jgi:ubiquinone/menaquinone biosynthesis C-methylase UbiE
MAAELIQPGGTLISSDGAEAMVEVARRRAAEAGVDNVEFSQLELEWIDLPTGSLDAVLCRWGIMLIVDPEAAAREVRRVLRSGGKAAFAVWDVADNNPWATIPSQTMIALGHAEPPDPNAPGMFKFGAPGALQELLESAGFVDVLVAPVALERKYGEIGEYIDETIELSPTMGGFYHDLPEEERAKIVERITAAAQQYVETDGILRLPGSSLVALASA